MLETRNPFSVLLSRFYLRANVMSFSVWFFALLGFYGLTSWLAIILGQHGFSVVKSIGFITLITFGGIPGFYTRSNLARAYWPQVDHGIFFVSERGDGLRLRPFSH